MAATVRLISLVLLFLVAPLVQAQDESAGADVPAAAETQLPEETPQPEAVVEETGPADDTLAESAEVSRDVVLVLDNSGSMRKNDPQSLAPAAVEKFIQELDPASRVALLIFDEDVTLVQDFINVESGRDQLLGSLDAIDYSGQYTDSPAGHRTGALCTQKRHP
ncbi:MAG: VWA domain-containing protein [Gammaproteobacteria bacterium]|nr:VWA domain-containing protein [Gammaproteobacteria bacterium]